MGLRDPPQALLDEAAAGVPPEHELGRGEAAARPRLGWLIGP